MPVDIRDKAFIGHDDVIGLNFIKKSSPFFFRRHFRQGLRSHVMEILKLSDVQLEKEGIVIDGLKWYPKARPFKIFRLFRSRLKTVEIALGEIGRVKIVEKYLAPDYLARSDEFIVDYMGPEGRDLVLCGFQEYVEGEILDPWGILEKDKLTSVMYDNLVRNALHPAVIKEKWIRRVERKVEKFIGRIKRMIVETSHVPDLAGVGNIIIANSGEIKLVDINNISRVVFDTVIRLDDKGYPVCDKSIEALAHLEHKVLGGAINNNEPIYKNFLDPQRIKAVQAKEQDFDQKKKNALMMKQDSGND